MKKGVFITIYGINNIGKSTHAKLLLARLREKGLKAEYVKYPVYDVSPSGPFINDVLRSGKGQNISEEELQLWYVLNRYQFEPRLKKMLDEGTIVIAEDYAGTGIAWGMAKGLAFDWVYNINSHVLKEDFSILIEGERSLISIEKQHVHEQNVQLTKKCIKIHSELADKFGWKRVKIQPKVEDTAEILWSVVEKTLVDDFSIEL